MMMILFAGQIKSGGFVIICMFDHKPFLFLSFYFYLFYCIDFNSLLLFLFFALELYK